MRGCAGTKIFAQGIDNQYKIWYNKCVIKERE